MAKLSIEVAYLHNTFILAGKNLGPTIEKKKITGIELVYDQEEKELWVTYNQRMAIVPFSNIGALIPEQGAPVIPISQVEPHHGKVKAQASTPIDHVFAKGPGKTNDR